MESDNNMYEQFNDINQEELEEGKNFENKEELIQGNINNEGYDEEEIFLGNDDEQLNYQQEYDLGDLHNINTDYNDLQNINNQKMNSKNINENNEFFQESKKNINESNKFVVSENNLPQKKHNNEINSDKLEKLREEINNISDSELDEPKNPSSFKNIESINNQNINNVNKHNLISDTQSNNNRFLHDLEEENKILKEEISNKEEIIKAKEKLNKEYLNLLSVFKDKIAQNDLYQKNTKNHIDDLNKKLNEKDLIINEYKKRNNIIEKNFKSMPEKYIQQINDLRKNFEEKEKKNEEIYNQKEKKLINDFMEEINKYTNDYQNLKIENEKLKYDLYNHKTENKNLNNKISELQYENKDLTDKKNKEINKLKEKISFIEKDLNNKDLQMKNNINNSDNNIQKFKKENNILIQQINQLNEKNKNYILEIMEYKHNMEMMNDIIAKNEIELKNKDSIIDQLGIHINEMNEEIDEKINDLQIYEENNQKEIIDYTNKIEELLKDKKVLEIQNSELSKNLDMANNILKEYNEILMNNKNIENKLNIEQEDKNNIIEKYKDKIQKIKIKYINLKKENNKMKDYINKIKNGNNNNNYSNFLSHNNYQVKSLYNSRIHDDNFVKNKLNIDDLTNVNNYMNKTMFNINFDTSEAINGNQIINNTYNSYNNKINLKENNSRLFKSVRLDDNHKKNNEIINEFRDFLKKMDEKLEIGKNK